MPLSYSIATGIGLGFIAYVVLKVFAGCFSEINAGGQLTGLVRPSLARYEGRTPLVF